MKEENCEQILMSAQKENILDQLRLQVEKDFLLANCPIELPTTNAQFNMTPVIKEKVYFLLMEKFSEYLNLLYVIDIPEKDFKDIDMTDAVVVSQQVTFLILKREYQKVRTRKRYS